MPEWDLHPDEYREHAGFVSDLTERVVALLDAQPGERIMDLGCGDGALTARLAAHGCTVVGVDSDAGMAEAARKRGLTVLHTDAATLRVHDAFDAVFSNAALHWMTDQEGATAAVGAALRPGGRFVAEMGGFGNVAAVRAAAGCVLARHRLRLPEWRFPTAHAQEALLARHGLDVEVLEVEARPTLLPTGVTGWLGAFARPALSRLAEPDAKRVLDEVEQVLAPVLRDDQGRWFADYVRLRFRARKPWPMTPAALAVAVAGGRPTRL